MNTNHDVPDEGEEAEPLPVPVALEAGHHDAIASLAARYRDVLDPQAAPPDKSSRPHATPPELLPLAERFVATSESGIVFERADAFGLLFSYQGDEYGDNREFFTERLRAEVQALGIGEVEHVTFRGGLTFRIALAEGGYTHWFFHPSQQQANARRFFAEAGGLRAFDAYRLSFHENMEGGGHYTYWQPPDAPPLLDVLQARGATLNTEVEDGSAFSIEFTDGEPVVFNAMPHDPRIFAEQARQEFLGLQARANLIRSRLPPVPPGMIRVFRGIVGEYRANTELTPAEAEEFEGMRSNIEAVDTEALRTRFGELFRRSRGEMGTPDLDGVLSGGYATGPDATLLYADMTVEDFEEHRDKFAPSSVLSGYCTFPPGSVAWNAVRLADMQAGDGAVS